MNPQPIQQYDIKVELIHTPYPSTFDRQPSFVKVTHVPTGITSTKYHKYQITARDEAIFEIECLLEVFYNV